VCELGWVREFWKKGVWWVDRNELGQIKGRKSARDSKGRFNKKPEPRKAKRFIEYTRSYITRDNERSYEVIDAVVYEEDAGLDEDAIMKRLESKGMLRKMDELIEGYGGGIAKPVHSGWVPPGTEAGRRGGWKYTMRDLGDYVDFKTGRQT